MMEYLVICLFAFLASGLTFFSGFGLGTILLPVFAFFFPVEVAIALTAIVHFLTNLFKLTLIGKKANRFVLIKFGVPAFLFALLGAYILTLIADSAPILMYSISGNIFYITPVKLIIAVLLAIFALIDMVPSLKRIQVDQKYLPLGGSLSGFFGGLSGHQGALRTAFLIRANLSKEEFIATGIVIAVIIDISRLSVYAGEILQLESTFNYPLLAAAVLAAFLGAFLGNKLLKKITIQKLQLSIGALLLIFSVLLGAGII
ncbi:TSUP family transporter [Gillisia limnaea]|nr:TSUP family transporter [Gillisia limnaea]